MSASNRTAQLQIRVTPAEKAAIAREARRAGLGMSAYVLSRALPARSAEWRERLRELAIGKDSKGTLADLSRWIAGLAAGELRDAVSGAPPAVLSEFHRNYVAAMVEQACAMRGVRPPLWCGEIAPLQLPYFASELPSLRLHLLRRSPAPFRRRNLFVDSTTGAQV